MQRPPFVVFTDLDGTLLDPEDYSYEAAAPALARLVAAGVPVILASSKTAAEIAPIRADLGLSAFPAIVENGAGLLDPGAEAPDDPGRYRELRAALGRLPASVRAAFQGFGDWDLAMLARRTGLPRVEAELAARRRYSEPGLWRGSDAQKLAFVAGLAALGISVREGGRFLTLSFGGTKASRMAEVAARYGNPFTVALGDGPNDVEMLGAADLGFVIANPHRPPLPPVPGEAEGRIVRIDTPGPEGWTEAMDRVIADRGL